MVSSFRIGGAAIGRGRCFIIAEAGVNHNGQVDLAHRLIDAAADAGADAVKFQTFEPSLVVSATAAKAAYQQTNTRTTESQLEMLRGLVLPLSAYQSLLEHARLREIFFLSSPFDECSAEFLANLNIPAFKVASGELTNHPFLRLLARMGRPLLVSTGMATQDETRSALEAIHRAHVVPIALFHCVSNYPADPAECNLRAMDTLRAAFGAPTGWSDHTAGTEISLAAAARGADLIEKHLTLDRSLPGPDHQASLEPSELAELVRTVRTIEVALGDGIKRPMPAEAPISELVRRSLHTRRALPAGHRLRADDLVALRPGTGISPAAMDRVVDRALARSLGHFEPLAWQDLE